MLLIAFYVLCVIFVADGQYNTNPLHNKIYKSIDSVSPCILRLNGTRTFGCSSNFRGNAGIIYKAQNIKDIRWLESNGASGPFVVIMRQNLFTLDSLTSLNKLDSVKGVLLLANEKSDATDSFSNEDTCPNRYSGLARIHHTCSETTPWNPWGSQIMLQKWKFPIFVTKDDASRTAIDECYTKFNTLSTDTWLNQQCSLQMFSHMFAGVDSRTCIRRGDRWLNLNPMIYCDPLANKNIYVPLYPLHLYAKTRKRSVIVIAARLDATSMFYTEEPGSLAASTGIVTLLTTAKVLFSMLPYNEDRKYDKNVLFMLFNGEAYDYIGSGRTVYDMKEGNFPYRENPIRKEDIRIFIELSQIYNNKTVVTHYIRNDQTNDVVTNFTESFRKYAKKYEIDVDEFSTDKLLPPASFQSFLVADDKLPGLVLGSYKERFTNRFYHSIHDDVSNVNYVFYNNSSKIPHNSLQAYITNISIALGSTLYTMINHTEAPPPPIKYQLVNELLLSYLGNGSFPIFQQIFKNISLPFDQQMSYYVGARGSSRLTVLSTYMLAYLTSIVKPNVLNADNCSSENKKNSPYRYLWFSKDPEGNGFCVQSTVNTTDAISPAFIIEGYDMTSNEYSTWTESQWRMTEIRMFISPSRRYEVFTFGLGFCTFVISSLIIYRVKNNLEYLGIEV